MKNQTMNKTMNTTVINTVMINTEIDSDRSQFRSIREIVTLIAVSTVAVIGSLLVGGCGEDTIVEPVIEDVAPPAPQGVYTIRGDNRVTVIWLPVEASDLDHYDIYRGDDSANLTPFTLIGSSQIEEYIDDPVTNGTRYYYVVIAVDAAGNESLQSAAYGGATPRPDGFNIELFTDVANPSFSGFDLSSGDRVAFNDLRADIWIEEDLSTGIFYINADAIDTPSAGLGDIQDMGYTQDLDEISFAPIPPTLNGWSLTRSYEVVDGHTYVIWTQDDRFSKVRIDSQFVSSVFISYAYQSGVAQDGSGGEPELAPQIGSETDITRQIIRSRITSSSEALDTEISTQPKSLGLSGASQ